MKSFRDYLKEEKDMRPLENFVSDTEKKHGATIRLEPGHGNELHLYHLEVPKDKRKSGIGSRVLQDIHDYADQNKKRITLNPASRDDKFGTTSRNRLIKFYKRNGYTHNKGRNKDFRTSAAMYRDPKVK